MRPCCSIPLCSLLCSLLCSALFCSYSYSAPCSPWLSVSVRPPKIPNPKSQDPNPHPQTLSCAMSRRPLRHSNSRQVGIRGPLGFSGFSPFTPPPPSSFWL
ncbi:hypothetical protein V8C37DRAFT_381027 [Trichoderma ceciliae]